MPPSPTLDSTSTTNSEIDRPTQGQIGADDASEEQSLNPQQFSIAELFWVSVAVAVVLAIVTPLLRRLPQAVLNTVVIAAAIQSIAIVAFAGYISNRRKRMLETSGKRIVLGSSSESPSVKWAVFFSFVSIFFTVAMQLYISAGLVWALSGEGDVLSTILKVGIIWFQSMGPMMFMTQSIRFLRWRIRSDAVEFFENGVAIFDLLTPWGKVELRPSQFHQNRVMVYYPEQQTSVMVWLDKSETDHLLSFAAEKCRDFKKREVPVAKL